MSNLHYGSVLGKLSLLSKRPMVQFYSTGSLSKNDSDDNENVKIAIDLDWQNNNFARASRFFVHFYAVVARLQRESA